MTWISRMHLPLCFLVLFMAVGVAALPASARAAIPPNDDFANATDLGNGVTASASGSNLWATAEAREPVHVSGRAIASVWYRWTAPQSGVVSVRTCGSTFDTMLAVFRGPAFGALGRVAANDDRCGDQSALRYFAIAGTTYHIAIGGFKAAQGSIELKLRHLVPPLNDDFADALDLGNKLTASASGTNGDATVEPREPDHDGRKTIASVWYRWTAPASRKIEIETCDSDFDTMIAVYVGPGFDALRSVASNDDHDRCGGEGAGSVLRFNSFAGTTYDIAVAGYGPAQGLFELKLAKLKPNKRRGETEPVRRLQSA
jgi:hypothetical protein